MTARWNTPETGMSWKTFARCCCWQRRSDRLLSVHMRAALPSPPRRFLPQYSRALSRILWRHFISGLRGKNRGCGSGRRSGGSNWPSGWRGRKRFSSSQARPPTAESARTLSFIDRMNVSGCSRTRRSSVPDGFHTLTQNMRRAPGWLRQREYWSDASCCHRLRESRRCRSINDRAAQWAMGGRWVRGDTSNVSRSAPTAERLRLSSPGLRLRWPRD